MVGSITLGFEPMASSSLINFLDFRIVYCYFVDLNFDIIFCSLTMSNFLNFFFFFFA